MQRHQLEHLIRSASAIADVYEIVVIGSQSILGSFPFAPEILLESMEADVYPLLEPEKSDLIDGSIGELSMFEKTYGYYAQGVSPETAILPLNWEARLVKIQNENTDLKVGFCLEPHDLAVSKLAAGREKDWPFVSALIAHKMIELQTLVDRIKETPRISDERQAFLARWVTTHPHENILTQSKDLDRARGWVPP